ncbi:C1 family peptidase [Acetobacteroides hydrogenigenes]|uniref:Papain like protease n=1 Tax=Acetobacteroides hydrogenigenes TaxID=979970 RepID=A0A4R2EWI8_9BACT|nr:C1 family peptidase [Acetobacteroides hydrogenigenes]TCN73048.1 papain like protease [Acetobacteroides hydrogenigenes]
MKKTRIVVMSVAAAAFLVAAIVVSCQKEDGTNADGNLQPVTHQLGCLMLPTEMYMGITLTDAPVSLLKAAPTVLNLNVPPVGDQGGEGSCVAWGTTYAGRSINWQASHPDSWSKSVNIFSPEYVYNQIKATSSCASGAYVTDGLKLLVNEGVVPWNVMPYTDVSCSLMPTADQEATAATYKVASYGRVSITADAIKAALVSGKPVIVGGPVNSAFMYLRSGAVLGKFTGRSLGGHCYCVVGYDDSKQAFKFMNSWGPSWATSGFGYISYKYVKSWFQEAYVLN